MECAKALRTSAIHVGSPPCGAFLSMARPKKNNAEYFPHDADMRNDIKVKALRRRFSHTGYAVWNYLLETLTDSDFFEVERSGINSELLAADYDVTVEQLNEIIDYCLKIELLQEEGDRLFSNAHKQRFAGLITKRERDRERLASAVLASKTYNSQDFRSENPNSKVKESKGKENKEEDIFNISLSLDNMSDAAVAERERILEIFYFEKNCVDYFGETQRFIAHYEADGWCRKGNDKPVKDRVALARSWKVETPVNRTDLTLLTWHRKIYDKVKAENPQAARSIIRDIVSIKYLQPKDGIEQIQIAAKNPAVAKIIDKALQIWPNDLRMPNTTIWYRTPKTKNE